MRFEGEIREVTPGKWVSKNEGSDEGLFSRVAKWADGRKSVQVKDPSFQCQAISSWRTWKLTRLGMAMNMNSLPGQICKWCCDIRNSDSGILVSRFTHGGIVNSHHRVSMYSCW